MGGIRHIQTNWRSLKQLEFRWRRRQRQFAALTLRGLRGRVVRPILLLDHAHGLAQFLFGNRARRINSRRALKLRSRRFQLSALAQLHAVFHVQRAGLKPRLVELNQVFCVLGIVLQRFLVVVIRGVIILKMFGPPPLSVVRLTLRAARCQHTSTQATNQLATLTHALSTLCLFKTKSFESSIGLEVGQGTAGWLCCIRYRWRLRFSAAATYDWI